VGVVPVDRYERPPGPDVRLLASHGLAAVAMSMPWPAVLAHVWSATQSDGWLGVAGAARMLPYVVLSALAGMLADRVRRTRVLRWSTGIRVVLLTGCALALQLNHVALALVLAVVTVAAGTPAYPAAVAAMPKLAGPRSARLTDLVVTAEVTAFVVGPAFGGVLIGMGDGSLTVWLAAGVALAAFPLLLGLDSGPVMRSGGPVVRGRLRTVLTSPGVPVAIAVVAVVNAVQSAASVGLVGLSDQIWAEGQGGFGIATAALGFGSLTAPALAVLLRLRGSLLLTGAGLAAAGVTPGVAVAATPLALAGGAGTVVECVSTEVLQRSVPDHVRAFALGLADSVMVSAAMIGSLVAPQLMDLVGPSVSFVALGAGATLTGLAVWRLRFTSMPVDAELVTARNDQSTKRFRAS
jgi:MFS family permease